MTAERGLLVIVLVLGTVHLGAAQGTPAPVAFERLDGLSHGTVFAVLQDHRGFLWIGTADGLNRYDGYAVTVFRHDPRDAASLPNNTIRTLAEGPDGALWVGTDGGLARLDPATGRFRRYAPGGTERIYMLVRDRDGGLWATSFDDPVHLFRYDAATDAFVGYRVGGDVSAATPTWLVVDHEGVPWGIQAREDGIALFRYDAGRDRFGPAVEVDGPTVQDPVVPGRSATWAVVGGTAGRLDLAAARFEPRVALPPAPAYHELLEARDGALWVSTDAGGYRIDPVTGAHRRFLDGEGGAASLSSYVLALYEDRTGIVWAGTRSGLYRYDPNEKPFVHFGAASGLGVPPGGVAVMAVAEAHGACWVGTFGDGLLRLDSLPRQVGAAGHVTAAYRHDARDPRSLPSDQVWALHAGPDGRLWVGTEAGLAALDPASGRFTSYPLPLTRSPSKPDGVPAVYTLTPGRDGTLWALGPWDVHQLDPADGTVLRHVSLGERLDHLTAQAVHVARRGPEVVWIGIEGGGLVRYEPEADRLTRYPTGVSDASGLPGTTVWTIHGDARGRLWLGTDLGLVRFDPSAETFRLHYDPETLPGALVYSILEDARGRLWMGTSQGLARFDPRTGAFRHYDAGDGLGNREFNRRAALESADGTFFFGGLDGLTRFDPEAIVDNPHVPPVVITQVEVFEGEGARRLRVAGPLRLSHRENTLAFRFAALGFTRPEKNRYAYRLEGFDPDWVDAGTARLARYTRLPPGDYVFRVRGANNDGVWNTEGAALRLAIAPPFWGTWWFRLLALSAAVGLLVAAYRYRVRHLLAVERLRLRIAADLHDDVGSRLSGIALLSEMVREQPGLGAPERGELTRIGAEARGLVTTLREIVWFVDPEHDRPGVLVEKMRAAAATLLGGTPHTFDAAPGATLAAADAAVRRAVYLIYKEALHNVARHAEAGRVTITVAEEAGAFALTVEDDGAGFDAEAAAAGQGLKSMRRRAAQIGAALTITSRPGAGTTVRLVVEIPRLRSGAGARRAAPYGRTNPEAV